MKRLLVASFACVLLAACSAVAADPPGPGKHFDCSNGGTTSCASDDTGCVPGSKDNPSAANVGHHRQGLCEGDRLGDQVPQEAG